MRGSNPRPLAHKTNTLPTELMEPVCRNLGPTQLHNCRMRVRGLVVMIVACQVMDPGSIPGERIFVQAPTSHHLQRPTRFCSSSGLEPDIEVIFLFGRKGPIPTTTSPEFHAPPIVFVSTSE